MDYRYDDARADRVPRYRSRTYSKDPVLLNEPDNGDLHYRRMRTRIPTKGELRLKRWGRTRANFSGYGSGPAGEQRMQDRVARLRKNFKIRHPSPRDKTLKGLKIVQRISTGVRDNASRRRQVANWMVGPPGIEWQNESARYIGRYWRDNRERIMDQRGEYDTLQITGNEIP